MGTPGGRPGAVPAFLFLCSYSLFLSQSQGSRSKIPITLPFPFGYFCCVLFTSPLCDVTPAVCQTEGRRCLMRPLIFFSRLFFTSFYFYFIFKRSPPTQCCDTAFLSIAWQCRSQGISLFSFSLVFSRSPSHAHTSSVSPCFLHHNTSIHPGHC